MTSLEDKLKQHFVHFFDKDFISKVSKDNYDPHLEIAVLAGMMTEDDRDFYLGFKVIENPTIEEKSRLNKIKKIRDIAKNTNYACQYGAGPARLVKTANVALQQAKELYKTYQKVNWGWKEVAKHQQVKTIDNQQWLLNPISNLWYSLRSEKDIGSTLVQGSASFVFDLWVKYVLDKRPQLTAQFHDEIVLHIKESEVSEVEKLLFDSINKTNEILKLNVPLGIGVQTGTDYGAIH